MRTIILPLFVPQNLQSLHVRRRCAEHVREAVLKVDVCFRVDAWLGAAPRVGRGAVALYLPTDGALLCVGSHHGRFDKVVEDGALDLVPMVSCRKVVKLQNPRIGAEHSCVVQRFKRGVVHHALKEAVQTVGRCHERNGVRSAMAPLPLRQLESARPAREWTVLHYVTWVVDALSDLGPPCTVDVVVLATRHLLGGAGNHFTVVQNPPAVIERFDWRWPPGLPLDCGAVGGGRGHPARRRPRQGFTRLPRLERDVGQLVNRTEPQIKVRGCRRNFLEQSRPLGLEFVQPRSDHLLLGLNVVELLDGGRWLAGGAFPARGTPTKPGGRRARRGGVPVLPEDPASAQHCQCDRPQHGPALVPAAPHPRTVAACSVAPGTAEHAPRCGRFNVFPEEVSFG
mmetsp:Transcript_18259/g.47698  ORF Transcript_18259/g.47698 Transcript_18259/m.47698 type:complete len:397 (+) Transcript_18259:390-1580(+)